MLLCSTPNMFCILWWREHLSWQIKVYAHNALDLIPMLITWWAGEGQFFQSLRNISNFSLSGWKWIGEKKKLFLKTLLITNWITSIGSSRCYKWKITFDSGKNLRSESTTTKNELRLHQFIYNHIDYIIHNITLSFDSSPPLDDPYRMIRQKSWISDSKSIYFTRWRFSWSASDRDMTFARVQCLGSGRETAYNLMYSWHSFTLITHYYFCIIGDNVATERQSRTLIASLTHRPPPIQQSLSQRVSCLSILCVGVRIGDYIFNCVALIFWGMYIKRRVFITLQKYTSFTA